MWETGQSNRKTPREWSVGKSVPFPTGEVSGGKAVPHPQKNGLNFRLKMMHFRGILQMFFIPKSGTLTPSCHSRSLEIKPLDRSYMTYY